MEVCYVVQKCFILATMDCKQRVLKHNEVELRCLENLNKIILSIKFELARYSTLQSNNISKQNNEEAMHI